MAITLLHFIQKIIGIFLRYKLPREFKGSDYLYLNNDVKEAGIDPIFHYVKFGRSEGRPFTLKLVIQGNYIFDIKKETVLLVSHEASLTGAPMLNLNLSEKLREKYNVVVLLLNSGPLLNNFLESGCAIVNLKKHSIPNTLFVSLISDLCVKFKFKYSIVSSVESRVVLKELKAHNIRTLTLVHEFLSCYVNPRQILEEIVTFSSEIIFSAKLTLDDAISHFSELANSTVKIMPQGKSVLPVRTYKKADYKAEKIRLLEKLDLQEDSFLVIGVGSVQYRKGVDLFIDVAKTLKNLNTGIKFKYVWIGKGYEPDKDPIYSVYLKDQIVRSNLDDEFVFINETFLLDEIYKKANLLLLTSRLDPLPNVAIDALSMKLPVVCFDKASGISDFMKSNKLDVYCVSNYLDTYDMARKIVALAGSKSQLNVISSRGNIAASEYFNMDKYVSDLDDLGSQV